MPRETSQPEATDDAKTGKVEARETDLESLIKSANTWDTVQTYIGLRLDAMATSTSLWRRDLERFQRQAENNFSDRLGGIDTKDAKDADSAWNRIFSESNSTMDIVGGFADFVYAQAANDIFGARPWLSAQPVGKKDTQLASDVSRYIHHKFSNANVESAYLSALKRAVDLGTAFPKWIFTKTPDFFERRAAVLADADENPVLTETGDYIEPDNIEEAEAMGIIPEGAIWSERVISETVWLDNNVEVVDVSFRDMLFDITARDFDLRFTDIFTRVKVNVIDAARIYGISIEDLDAVSPHTAKVASADDSGEGAEPNRAEQSPEDSHRHDEKLRNYTVELWEGFVRMDPIGDGKPRRMFVVYDRNGQKLLKADYLANITPKGILPIHPIRIYRLPGRAYGKGIYERYEHLTNDVDGFYNSLAVRAQYTKPILGRDKSVIEYDEEEDIEELEIRKPVELKTGKKLSDYLQFLSLPETGGDINSLLQQIVQIGQMRTGISAASQGELSSVPDNSTATGIQQLQSRAVTLLKWPINDAKRDCLPGMSYGVRLLLSNQDIGETFIWGEGETAELIEITPERIHNLEIDVKLSMSQTQNLESSQNTQQAIQVVMQYLSVPEPEKQALRPLFVQAVKSLGFDHADQFLRDAIFDPMQIAAMLPPEIAAMWQAFVSQMQSAQPAQAPAQAPDQPATNQSQQPEEPTP